MDFCCPERCPELPTGFLLSTQMSLNYLISLVPGERFELPTNGLQNRCSTTELTRRFLLYYNTLSLFHVWQNRLPDFVPSVEEP
jgi:hypothetical protein